MSELFDPDFVINFQAEKDLSEIVSDFMKEFEKAITWWQGYMGQSEKYYVDFGWDHAYEMNLTPYPYKLTVAGRESEYDSKAQQKHREFARSIVRFLEERGCTVEFNAFFPLADE